MRNHTRMTPGRFRVSHAGHTEEVVVDNDEDSASHREQNAGDSDGSDHDKSKDNVTSPQLLSTLSQDKQCRFQCVDYQMDPYSNYDPKFGDLQKWRIYNQSEDEKESDFEDLWFLKDSDNHKARRKVFVDGKVHRVWKINTDDDTFEASLHLFMSWMITKEEYMICIAGDKKAASRPGNDLHAPSSAMSHDKIWYPSVHIPNMFTGKSEFVENGGAKFRVVSYKKFAGFGTASNANTTDFQIENAKFIRCKMEISGTFHAYYELKNFPFDLQNMTIHIMERSGRGTFLPALRERKYFMSVDAICYEVKEWDLVATMFEFVDANPSYDTSSFGKALSQFIVEFKYKRNYWMYMLKYGLVTCSITALSLLAFTFPYAKDNNVDRCGFIVGLVLTIAFMDYQRPNTDQQTLFDQYIIACHLFLVAMTTMAGILPHLECVDCEQHLGNFGPGFFVASVIFCGYHLCFILFAKREHREEMSKIYNTYNMNIERMVHDESVTLNKMQADYTNPLPDTANELAFMATKKMD